MPQESSSEKSALALEWMGLNCGTWQISSGQGVNTETQVNEFLASITILELRYSMAMAGYWFKSDENGKSVARLPLREGTASPRRWETHRSIIQPPFGLRPLFSARPQTSRSRPRLRAKRHLHSTSSCSRPLDSSLRI